MRVGVEIGKMVARGSVRLVGEQCGLGTGSDRSVAPAVTVLVSCAFRVRFACVDTHNKLSRIR